DHLPLSPTIDTPMSGAHIVGERAGVRGLALTLADAPSPPAPLPRPRLSHGQRSHGGEGGIATSGFGDLAGEYPFADRFLDIDGLRYHYVDEGTGEVLLFVHGNPTWSFAW